MMEESSLFSDVKFILAQCNDQDAIKAILLERGAKHINYLSEHVTHVIADAHCPEAEEAVELFDKPVVRSLWVHMSLKAQRLLPTEAFSLNKNIFNNVTASFSKELSDGDIESLAAILTYYGAKVAKDISASSTHLITPKTPSNDTLTAGVSSEQLRIVAPDWVLDSVKQNSHLDETIYDPGLLLSPPPPTPTPPPPPPQKLEPVTNSDTETTKSNVQSSDSTAPQSMPNNETLSKQSPAQKPQQLQSQNSNHFPHASPHEQQNRVQQIQPQHHQSQQHSNQQHQMHRHPMQTQQFGHQELQQYTPIQHKLPQQQQHQQHQQPQQQQQQLHTQPQMSNMQQQQPQIQLQMSPSQQQMYQQQQSQQTLRPRMPTNVIRGAQPRFRPILPNTTMPMQQRQITQPQRIMVPDPQQQQKKVSINYGNQYRKINPYQNNIETPQQASYQTQHTTIHQQPNQVANRPQQQPHQQQQQQQHIHHQIRMPYQNDSMAARAPGHHQIINQPQHPQQSMQIVNRFQDSNAAAGQRQYQMCVQSQPANNFQQVNLQRQPIYYSPNGPNQVHIRIPQQQQQGALMRPVRPDQGVYNQPHLVQEQIQPQHQYVSNASQQTQMPPIQQQQPQQPHPQQILTQHHTPQNMLSSNLPKEHNPDFHPQITSHPNAKNVQPVLMSQEQRHQTLRMQNPPQPSQDRCKTNIGFNNVPPPLPSQVSPQAKVVTQAPQQPHPQSAVFDKTHDSNHAQARTRVPTFIEKIDYVGHEASGDVPKDLPLIGCRFKMIDHEHLDPKLKKRWCEAISAAGGTFKDELNEISHLICENTTSETFAQALKLGVRCITIYWVNDVLSDNRLRFPWKALHLPTSFNRSNRPLKEQIISTTNLSGRNRREVREMIVKAGARYTDYFSTSNTLLICGKVGGEKFERALEWKTPIANCQLLSDVLLSDEMDFSNMLTQPKYQLFGLEDPLKLKSYILVKDLMLPWKKTLTWDKSEAKQQVEAKNEKREDNTAQQQVNNKPECPPITTQQSVSNVDSPLVNGTTDQEQSRQPRRSDEPIRLLFTSLTENLKNQLKNYAQSLGLGFASSPIDCTHLIVDRLSRTPKFVCAINYATHILSYKWLTESYKAKQLLDEKQFVIQDSEGEEKYSFNLVHSLLKRRKRGSLLFRDFIFFATPSVMAKVINLKEMIDSAGAILTIRKLPSRMQLDQINRNNKRFVVITNEDDLHLCSEIEQLGVDLMDVEFVISGILRQDIDFDAHRIKSSPTTFNKPIATTELTNSSPKRLKVDHSHLKTDFID